MVDNRMLQKKSLFMLVVVVSMLLGSVARCEDTASSKAVQEGMNEIRGNVQALRTTCDFSASTPLDLTIAACTELIDSAGKDSRLRAWATTNRGLAYERQASWGSKENKERLVKLARQQYHEATRLNPAETDGYRLLGDSYYNSNTGQAIIYYQKVARLDPKQSRLMWKTIAWLYDARKEYENATVMYTRAINEGLDPAGDIAGDPLSSRARDYVRLGKLPLALADYNEAIRRSPMNITWYPERGDVYQKMHDYPKALADFDHALYISQNRSAEAFWGRGRLRREQGDITGAKADFERAATLDPRLRKSNF